jgi:hypothetical protein
MAHVLTPDKPTPIQSVASRVAGGNGTGRPEFMEG